MSEKVLSIDVGVKNLSLCYVDRVSSSTFHILQWKNIDVSIRPGTITDITCTQCHKKAVYTLLLTSECFCTKHAKEFGIISCKLFTSTILGKKSMHELEEIASQLHIECTDTKKSMIKRITDTYNERKLIKIVGKKASEISIQDICRNVTLYLDEMHMEHIDTILIENQIGPIAVRMKTIQGILTQYFTIRNSNANIVLVNACIKLKPFIIQEEYPITYSSRKKNGILACAYILQDIPDQLKYMQEHKKKDDLCDCFLQFWSSCIWDKSKINLPGPFLC